MKSTVIISDSLEVTLRAHLFQNHLEQGAFLFAQVSQTSDQITFTVADAYLVPQEGWFLQMEDHLEMKDAERARIMKRARDGDFAVVDCHSHPRATDDVWFSPSDRSGIEEFAAYARWKLDGKPYVGTVWGTLSLDAVLWHGEFAQPLPLGEVQVIGARTRVIIPRGSWFRPPLPTQRRQRRGR